MSCAAALVPVSAALAQHDMSAMPAPAQTAGALGVPLARTSSGTAWLPDSASTRMAHTSAAGWSIMLHGAAFPMYDRQANLHGDSRAGLIDWEMAAAAHAMAGGTLRLTAMTSLESFALPDTGYAELLQTGETFQGRRIANTQHPHDLFGELSAAYEHNVTSKLATSFYAAVVGDPALGPVPYMHRPSADADPFAPIGHHWQDASHGSAGVVTAGAFSRTVRLEASAFNGREPNADRRDLDYRGQALDSYSARLTVLPAGAVAVSAWAGYIAHDDPLDTTVAMQQYGASVLTDARGVAGGRWSTALIWGLDNHHHSPRLHVHDATTPSPTHHPSASALVESTLGLGTRTQVFVRAEQVQKMSDDLGFLGGDLTQLFTIRALSGGVARQVASLGGVAFGLGARASIDFLPESLRLTYQGTRPKGFAVYVRLTPR
jgi:hypothetical protein